MHSISQNNTRSTPLFQVIMEAAAIWFVSDIGYYIALPTLGLKGGFSANPITITLYYLFWLVLTVFTFWNIYKEYDVVQNTWFSYFIITLGSALILLYLVYIFPLFPPITWVKNLQPPSELLSATPWYFLPKSIDILVQQLLVLAMVIRFRLERYSVRSIALWCALLFGGAHLLLVLGSQGALYIATFTFSAIIASFIFPYLLLKVRDGFIYSYLLHWFFYAFVIVLARLVFKF